MAADGFDRGTQAIGAALTFAVSVAMFSWGGWRADAALGTSPWLLILGALLGMTGGFLHLLTRLAPEVLPWTRRDAEGRRDADPHEHRTSDDHTDGDDHLDRDDR